MESISSKAPVNPYLEFHAAFSLLAYGAFVLAGLAGAMYLLQERQLKTRKLNSAFFELPPIHSLGVANSRLIAVGFVLLTVGMLAGFGIGRSTTSFKLGWSIGVWLLYGGILIAQWVRHLAPRRVANLSVLASCLAIATLWGITFISEPAVGNKGSSKLEIRNSKEVEKFLKLGKAEDYAFALQGAGRTQAFDLRPSTFDSFLRVSSFELRVSADATASASV